MSFVSYAQNYEDLRLWRAVGHVERGCYLDIGAQHPILDSVSKAFYDAGWRGAHVEPTPFYAAALRENRPDERVFEMAVGKPGAVNFYEFPDTGISTGVADIARAHSEAGFEVRMRQVPVVPLSKIFADFGAKTIHWMKIDVEGMEREVISSWGKSPAKPWVLVIESVHPSTHDPMEGEWLDLLLSRGYQEAAFDGLSRYFVADEHRDLAEAIAAPPNIFDDLTVTRHHFSVRGLVAEYASAIAELEASLVQAKDETSASQLRIEDLETAYTALGAERANIDSELVMTRTKAADLAAEMERAREAFATELALERSTAAALQAELEHRVAAIGEHAAAAEDEHHRKVAELEQSIYEAREALAAREEEFDRVRACEEAYRSAAVEAESLIRQAVESRRSRWRQLGEAIGLMRPRQIWRALADWSLPES